MADSSRAPIPGVTVLLTHLATNIAEYAINVELQGFKRFSQPSVVLRIGDVRKDAVLAVADLTESVTVSKSVSLLNTSGSTVGTVITNDQTDCSVSARRSAGRHLRFLFLVHSPGNPNVPVK